MIKLDLTDRPRLYRALLLGLVAATFLTFAANWRLLRLGDDGPFWRQWLRRDYGLNKALGLGNKTDANAWPLPDDMNAQQQAFIDNIAKRVRPFVSDPQRTYDVRVLMYYRHGYGRGMPWHTVARSAAVMIDAEGAGKPPTCDRVLADKYGLPPERPLGWVFNGLFFFICTSFVFWLADEKVRRITGTMSANWKVHTDKFLKSRRRARHRLIVGAAAVSGLLATGAASALVQRVSLLSFVGNWTLFNLNSAVGLSSKHSPEEHDPLSGAVKVNEELHNFCLRVAEDARPLIPKQHSEYAEVLVLMGNRHAFGWPLTTYETAAQVLIHDQPSHWAFKRWEDYKVDARGGSPFQWFGILGNWVFYTALTIPLLYLAELAFVALLKRLTRRQCAFPVIITDAHPPKPSGEAESPQEV